MSAQLPLSALQRAVAATSSGEHCRVEQTVSQLSITGGDHAHALSIATIAAQCFGVETASAAMAAITVPAKLLRNVVASMRGDLVTLTISPRQLTIQSPNNRATISPGGLVPRLPSVPMAQWSDVTMAEAVDISAALDYVLPAACTDTARENYWGVRWDGYAVAGADGNRIHSATTQRQLVSAATLSPSGAIQLAAQLADFNAAGSKLHQAARKRAPKGSVATPLQKTIVARMVQISGWIVVEVAEGTGTTGGEQIGMPLPATTSPLYIHRTYCRARSTPFADWQRLVANTERSQATVAILDVAALNAALKLPSDTVDLTTAQLSGTWYVTVDYEAADGQLRLGGGHVVVEAATVAGAVAAQSTARVARKYLLDALRTDASATELHLRGSAAPLIVQAPSRCALVMFVR